MSTSFTGTRAVVTGAASGIGRALVEQLLAAGATVLATDVNDDALAALVHDLDASRSSLLTYKLDVSDPTQMAAVKTFADENLGSVDLLCNNAGIAYNSVPIWDAPAEMVEWSYGVNVYGVINGIRAFVPDMIERGRGHVMNTASVGGFQVSNRIDVWHQGLYASTKYAVVALSESLAIELDGRGVGVTVFAPSAVATGIADSGRNRPERFTQTTDDASNDAMRSMLESEGIAPATAAEIALRGVLDNQLYVFTDTNLRKRIADRARTIDASFDSLNHPVG